jgi:hypothetical protein
MYYTTPPCKNRYKERFNSFMNWFVVIAYVAMAAYSSIWVHEYTHYRQAISDNAVVGEMCLMGWMNNSVTNYSQTFENDDLEAIMASYGAGGWLEFYAPPNSSMHSKSYYLGIKETEFSAYVMQILFFILIVLPLFIVA